jgi:predicted RNA-binding protein
MCLATVYIKKDEQYEPICSNITSATLENKTWIFTDFIGRKTKILGVIKEIDLSANTIYLSNVD